MSKIRNKKQKFTILEDEVMEAVELLPKPHDLLVYLVLCKHANKVDDTCFPAIPTIAKLARCSESSVKRALQTLQEVGLISVEERRNPENPLHKLSNLYTLEPIPAPFYRTGQSEPTLGSVRPDNYNHLTKEITITKVIASLDDIMKTVKEKAASLDKKDTYVLKQIVQKLLFESLKSKEEVLENELKSLPLALLYALTNSKCKQSVIDNKKKSSLMKVMIAYMNDFEKLPCEEEIDYMVETLNTYAPSVISKAITHAVSKDYTGDFDENIIPFIKYIEELAKIERMGHATKNAPKPAWNNKPQNNTGGARKPNLSDFDEF